MDKLTFKQHIPKFVETDSPLELTGSWQEISTHPSLKHLVEEKKFSWAFNPDKKGDPNKGLLMIHNQDNSRWYVIGSLSENPGLPIWVSPIKEPEYKKVVLSPEEIKKIEDRVNSKSK